MIHHAALVVGAGPTGLMLAGELALAGADVAIVERRSGQGLIGDRSRGVHARTIELFDQRGIAERFLAEGRTFSTVGFAWIRMPIEDLPTRHPYGLAIPQKEVERILAAWVEALGVPIYRDREVVGIRQDESGVEVELADGGRLGADYLVGCDGGRSSIRKAAGIDFPGWDPTISNLIAEAEFEDEPARGLRHDAFGVHSIGATQDSGKVGILVTEQDVGRAGEPTLRDLSDALVAVYGTDFGVHSPVSISRFTDVTRQAAAYRKGRVLLAGDAAHVHYPAGGLGLNLGLQDAVNLGWKLAQVIKDISPVELLDSYQDEQHPVATRVLRNTMAQMALLGRLDHRKTALRELVGELFRLDGPRKRLGAMMSGLDIRYDLGPGHPLLGCRMPDLDLATAEGPRRVYRLLHAARPVLLSFGEPLRLDMSPWAERVELVDAERPREFELPEIGFVTAPAAVLIRPDGHAGWVGASDQSGLAQALATWCGKRNRSSRSAPDRHPAVRNDDES